AVMGTQVPVTFRGRLHGGGEQADALGRRQTAAAAFQQLAIAQHRAQAFVQRFAADVVLDAQSFGDGIGAQQAAAFGQYAEDRFTARNRMFVALRLALGMRIGETMRVWLARLARGLRRLRTAARRRFLLVLAGFLLSARFARGTGRRAIA